MADEDERQKMEQWVKEIGERRTRKPTPRDHQESKEWLEKRNSSPYFQKNLEIGKSSELYVAEKLVNLKLTVLDISEERFQFKDGEFYSPFDLLVSSQFFLFVVDVKRRSYKVPVGMPILKLNDYEAYDKYDTEDKLIIYHFPIRRGHNDCLFIAVKDIRDRCYTVGPFYHIEMHQLTPLTSKALINSLKTRSC